MSITPHTHMLWPKYLKSIRELSQQFPVSWYINYHNLPLFVMDYILQYITISYR